jgi:NADH-quinone oxidoreductase subunit E
MPARADADGGSSTVGSSTVGAGQAGLTEETRLRAREIIARYPRPRSALLPMLHLVQAEEGFVSPEGIALCAEELGLTKAEVGAVATFYTMYKRRPAGDWLVSVCTNTLCGLLGGEAIFAALSEHLGVGHDQTTSDGTITLEHAECLAACDYAPVVTVNYEFYDQQTPDSALGLVRDLRAGDRPAPSRGAPLCTFAEIARQLAGFADDRDGAVRAGPAGEPTLVGARLALQRRETAPPYPDGSPGARAAVAASGDGGKPTADGATRPQPSSHGAPLPTSASDRAQSADKTGSETAGSGVAKESDAATAEQPGSPTAERKEG